MKKVLVLLLFLAVFFGITAFSMAGGGCHKRPCPTKTPLATVISTTSPPVSTGVPVATEAAPGTSGHVWTGANFQAGECPTISGTVYVTDGWLGGKIFFSHHFEVGECWSGWLHIPHQWGVPVAFWVADQGGNPVELVISNGWFDQGIPNMLEIHWP